MEPKQRKAHIILEFIFGLKQIISLQLFKRFKVALFSLGHFDHGSKKIGKVVWEKTHTQLGCWRNCVLEIHDIRASD